MELPPQNNVAKLKHWDIYLHPNQNYLARFIFQLKREGTKDALSNEEQEELNRAIDHYKNVLLKDLKPDKIDEIWTSEGNLRLELVPRYSTFRFMNGAEFNDPNFGEPVKDTEWKVEVSARAFLTKMLVMRFKQAFINF